MYTCDSAFSPHANNRSTSFRGAFLLLFHRFVPSTHGQFRWGISRPDSRAWHLDILIGPRIQRRKRRHVVRKNSMMMMRCEDGGRCELLREGSSPAAVLKSPSSFAILRDIHFSWIAPITWDNSAFDLRNWIFYRMREVFSSLPCRNQSPHLIVIQPGKIQTLLRPVNGWIAWPST